MNLDYHIHWTYLHTLAMSVGLAMLFWLTGAPLQYILYVLIVYPILHVALYILRR